MIQNRDLCCLARRVSQRDEVGIGGLAQIEVGRHDVAEDEALDAELDIAARLGHESRTDSSVDKQAERRGARNAGSRGQAASDRRRLAEREGVQQVERLRGRVNLVAPGARIDTGPRFIR